MVFWGINGLPLKYGLIDTIEKPEHNVTGIYQAGYLKENVDGQPIGWSIATWNTTEYDQGLWIRVICADTTP